MRADSTEEARQVFWTECGKRLQPFGWLVICCLERADHRRCALFVALHPKPRTNQVYARLFVLALAARI